MREQKQRGRDDHLNKGGSSWEEEELELPEGKTEFVGYETMECPAKILALLADGKPADLATEDEDIVVVLDKTPFYTESGGQVSDKGVLTTDHGVMRVKKMKKAPGGQILHIGYVKEGTIEAGADVTATVDRNRRLSIMRNHTGAHLLQAALRKVLGDHVHQAGQLVDKQMVRFDFTHFEPLTPAELLQIETIINEEIMSCTPVKNYEMGIEEAKAKGAMALFSEKYGNVVRVVEIGDFSMELCGGTHVKNTGELGLFKIVSESSVAAGVRRIEAVTGIGYLNATRALEATLFQAAGVLKLQSASELVKRCETLTAEVKEKDREINLLNSKLAGSKIDELLKSAHEEGGVLVVAGDLSGVNAEMLRSMGDQLRDKAPAICALLCGGDAEKKNFLCVAGPAAVKAGVHAGKIIKAVCQKTGGNGGGRPDSAMGGVGDPLLVEDAMSALADLIHEMLK